MNTVANTHHSITTRPRNLFLFFLYMLIFAVCLGSSSLKAQTVTYEVGDFNVDGYPELYGILKSKSGTGSTEVHLLSGFTYNTWLAHTGTALHMTGTNYALLVGDHNGDKVPDVYAIKKSGTGTGSTEVHILNGASIYKTWLLQTGTPLHETGDTFAFGLGDYNRDGRLDL